MAEYTDSNETKREETARILTKEEHRAFSGTTLDAEGKEMGRKDEFTSFIRFRQGNISPLVVIGGALLLGVLVLLFGGAFLVFAAVTSVIAFFSRLLK